MVQAIVFDLFNTLVEIKKPKYLLRELFKEIGEVNRNYSFQEFKTLIMTNEMVDVFPLFLPEFYNEYKEKEEELLAEVNSVRLIPGALETLDSLSNDYKLGLISNIATPYKAAFYRLNLTDFFDSPVFSCEVGFVKPKPEIYEIENTRLGIAKDKILMVGDSYKADYKAAINYGWKSIRIVRNGDVSRKFEIKDILELEEKMRLL